MAPESDVKIMAEPTPNPNSLKFTVDRILLEEGCAMIRSADSAAGSPLAEKLFALGEVESVFAMKDFISITKVEAADWRELAYKVGDTIRDHIHTGELAFSAEATVIGPQTDIDKQIVSIIDTIRPAVQGDGGDITFVSFDNGVVSVQMVGACSGCPSSTITLKHALEQRIREALPEVTEVVAV